MSSGLQLPWSSLLLPRCLQHRWPLSWVSATAAFLGRVPMALHLWTFLASPLWLNFHLPSSVRWPWKALVGVNPFTQCLHSAAFWNFGASVSDPLVFHISHVYKNSTMWVILPVLLAPDVACPSWITVAVASVSCLWGCPWRNTSLGSHFAAEHPCGGIATLGFLFFIEWVGSYLLLSRGFSLMTWFNKHLPCILCIFKLTALCHSFLFFYLSSE